MVDYFTNAYQAPSEHAVTTKLKPQQVSVVSSGYSAEYAAEQLPGAGYKGTEYLIKIHETVMINNKPHPKERIIMFTNDETLKGLEKRLTELGSGVTHDSLKGRTITALKQFDTFVGVRL